MVCSARAKLKWGVWGTMKAGAMTAEMPVPVLFDVVVPVEVPVINLLSVDTFIYNTINPNSNINSATLITYIISLI
jgi:hypothetical protein